MRLGNPLNLKSDGRKIKVGRSDRDWCIALRDYNDTLGSSPDYFSLYLDVMTKI